MPYKSKAQQRFMFAAEDRGELPKGTAKRWARHTKDVKALPEHVKKGASSIRSLIDRMHEKGEAEKLLKKKKQLAEANAKMLARQKELEARQAAAQSALAEQTKSAYYDGMRRRFSDAGLDPDAAMRWFKIK